MDDLVKLTPEEIHRRKTRSVAIGVTLAVLVVLFYVVTLIKFFPGNG